MQGYRYAVGEAGQFLDVRHLFRDTCHMLGPYKCLSSSDWVIPSMGNRVAHHFRHKQDRACRGK